MSKTSVLKIVLYCLFTLVLACVPAASSESLAESEHPYANNSEYKWSNISEPGATEIRLHFSDLDIGRYDKLIILDKYGNDLITYSGITKADFWTEWYAGDTLGVRLITSDQGTRYGFKIDKLDSRPDMCIPNNSLAESYHPYANNFEYKWPDISEPSATQIRIHFESLNLNYYDKLILFDKYDNNLATYDWNSDKSFWTEWYTGDTLKVKLITDESRTAYGFKIDKGEIKNDENITTAFSGSKEVNNEISRSKPEKSEDSEFSGEDSEKPQNPTINSDYIHNQFVKIAVTLNILEEDDDQSWIYRNIELVFGGFGTPLLLAMVGFLKRLKGKRSEDKKSEDEKSENEKPEDEK